MPLDYNEIYLVGWRKNPEDQWNFGQQFQFRTEADQNAERDTCLTGIPHYVFKAISYFTRDEITSSKTTIA